MDRTYEELCREKAAAGGALRGNVAQQQTAEVRMPSLRERCSNAEYRARTDASRAERMGELGYLLDKNPEVARILDLIEEVGR